MLTVVKLLSHVRIFCDPRNCSPLCSSVHWISQARILEWVAISLSRGSSWSRDQIHVSYIAGRFFTTEPPGKPHAALGGPHIQREEGNGAPLQYSCLENPMDGGAWWAAVYGVVQSRTWLKRLSSSSSTSKDWCPSKKRKWYRDKTQGGGHVKMGQSLEWCSSRGRSAKESPEAR